MQSPQKLTDRSAGQAAVLSSAAASPYVSLSTQCDLLYHIGSQPHSHAFLSEQSVYTRGAEQLRFHTPSPLQQPTVQIPAHNFPDESSVMINADGGQDAAPHLSTVAPPFPPFPSIRWFEEAGKAEEERQQLQLLQRSQASLSLWPVSSTAPSSSSVQTRFSRQLVPSGTGLATSTFQSDYPVNKSSAKHRHSGESVADGPVVQEPRAAVDATVREGKTTTPPLPQASKPSLISFFPSAVVMRAVAQMVLTMQAARQQSAAQFALAHYRGEPLPAWVRAVHRNPSLLTRVESAVLRDALVFSVLPQVVADRLAGSKHPSPLQEAQVLDFPLAEEAAVLYNVTPHCSCAPGDGDATAGKKHRRAEPCAETAGPVGAAAAVQAILPGAMCCTRLSGPSSTSSSFPLRYSAMTEEAFHTLHESTRGTAHQAAEVVRSAADTTVYDDESEWLTRGVLRRLFTFPATLSTNLGAPGGDANAAATLPASSKDATTEESRRGAHRAFLKTNAFLFLSFLVHHCWCLTVHETVVKALTAKLAASSSAPEAAHSVSSVAICVTCLPHLTEVRRSPQHEWRSELTYRLLSLQDTGDNSATQAFSTFTREAPSVSTVVWQLTVTVVNRSAALRWHRGGHLSGNVHAADVAAARETLTGAFAGRLHDGVEGAGTLEDLRTQL
ncbi:hypothetical protein ABB37_03306 [Leptomonas pyrrhocoris]|uniref:Uncharacterized protein n=1 Tax=Leptomonas pyrrhocoris TaxID=157538 RepID=A0A0M9G4W4_LEPPY|nr:hypothetical protein ABB37_03306 [Leptomonas pyrrhocoris]KPA82179.1 hypothetical protein ABB37_03306 [Leptomonas pyrrhocoris]|eukprot:XP_015660618.1 hypothetical protein ABB37_03306 [Leptomonas pyrrhocoris]